MARILLSGSTGLLGRRILADQRALGNTVIPLVRPDTSGAASRQNSIPWDPAAGILDPALVSGFDAVIHLSGEPVATGRWTPSKKQRILDSRVRSTHTLVHALSRAAIPPKAFLCASGINIYGDRGPTLLDESQPAGPGFLADVCRHWEAAAAALQPTARVVSLRIGAVLHPAGGILHTLLPLARLGLNGPVAGGHNFLSWISLDDLSRAVSHILTAPNLTGPLNLVAPSPVSNREFTTTLARALHRPALLPIPAWLLRLAFGQLAEETMLTSIRAIPRRLLDDGFQFQDPTLPEALARLHLTS